MKKQKKLKSEVKMMTEGRNGVESVTEPSTPNLLSEEREQCLEDIVKDEIDVTCDAQIKIENTAYLNNIVTPSSRNEERTYGSFTLKTIKEETVHLNQNECESVHELSVAEFTDLLPTNAEVVLDGLATRLEDSENCGEKNVKKEERVDTENEIKSEPALDVHLNFQINNVLTSVICTEKSAATESERSRRNLPTTNVTKSINNRGVSGSCIVKVPENEHLNMHDNEIISTARKKDLAEQKIDQNVFTKVAVHMNQDNVEASTNVYETEVETSPNESSEPNHFQKTKMLSKITNVPNIFLLHKCNECGICLHTASELFAHKRTHNSEPSRIGFSKQLQLDKHRNRQHKRRFQCAICEQVFNSKRNLTFHIKLHTDGVDKNDGCLYKCKYCAKLFALKNLYINHLKRIHQRVESVQVDGKTVCSSDESRTESLPASPSSERRRQHICRLCNKHFRTPYLLTRHMRVHNGERPFQCNICQKRFTHRPNLDSHAQRHVGNKPHLCSVSDKPFEVKADMIRHTRTHTEQRPYKCTECPKAFTQQSSLVRHTRTHTGVKPYVCSECNAAFTNSGHLTRHTRTHTGRRPYKCTECPKAFMQQSDLVRHTRTHTGVKPYVCPECNAAFTDSGGLTRHIRTHTGEKPYQCAICCSSFTQVNSLTRHKRIHSHIHNEN